MQDSGAEAGDAVPAYDMDELLRRSGFREVDLLKMDIEGAEKDLFIGNPSWLDRVNNMVIEFHGDSRQQCCFDEMIAARGFKIVDDNAHTVTVAR